jgi:uncharacterized protein (DUF1778 family)
MASMVKIEIYLNDEEDELLSKAVAKSKHATYSKFVTAAALKEAARLAGER